MRATFRIAIEKDIPAIISLLQDDPLGARRDVITETDLPGYLSAFEIISNDPNNEVWIVETDGRISGTFQLTFIPGLSRKGALRCQIESVRIDRRYRNQGLGSTAMRWAIERARGRGCKLIQLTSDNSRIEAHRFYERLGFAKSHAGFKLDITTV